MWRLKVFLTLCTVVMVRGCSFPTQVTHSGSEPWTGKIHPKDGQGELLVYFKENRMSVFVHKGPRLHVTDGQPVGVAMYNRTCVDKIASGRFLVSHEVEEKRPRYMCMEIVMRSKGVFQLKTSRLSRHIEPLLCYTADLSLDPWLFVSFNVLKKHHQISSLSGGFDMKIHSAQGDAYGCNSMELPMRLESECIGGDGVNFRFRYETCKEKLPMEVDQRTYCVADWIDGRYSYSILRKMGHDDLWCLRAPLIRGQNFTATLFLDAMCSSEEKLNSSVKFVSLNLAEAQPHDLCQDEYAGCSHERCTPYTEQSCQKSCGLCYPGQQIGFCKFPTPYRGEWLQKNVDSQKRIKISSSKITIENVGTFKCVQGGKKTKDIERKYALVSVFANGCRPRFTCIAFRRFGRSVLSYTLGQSIKWPFPPRTNVPEASCEDSTFTMDPRPIRDSVRGNLDTFKTIVSTSEFKTGSNCRLRSGLRIQGIINNSTCVGNLFEDCKDPSRLRMELRDCDEESQVLDFQCLAIYEGKYWENITILQNTEDSNDARCLVFSDVRPGEVLMMAASECDKKSWPWATGDERTALTKFQYQTEDYRCKIVPTKPPTTTTTTPPQEVTYKVVSSLDPVLRETTVSGRHNPPESVPRVATPPSDSLAKGNSLQSDSGNVGIVIAPRKSTNAAGLGIVFQTFYIVFAPVLTVLFICMPNR